VSEKYLVRITVTKTTTEDIYVPFNKLSKNGPSSWILNPNNKYRNIYGYLYGVKEYVATVYPEYLSRKDILDSNDYADIMCATVEQAGGMEHVPYDELYDRLIESSLFINGAYMIDLSDINNLNKLPEHIKTSVLYNLSLHDANKNRLEQSFFHSDYHECECRCKKDETTK